MEFLAHNIRLDAPAAADEIEVSPSSIAQAPVRVKKTSAVESLVKVAEEEARFASEIAARQAELSAERARAAGLQAQYEEMIASRPPLTEAILKAEGWVTTTKEELAKLEDHAELKWDQPLKDLIELCQRHEFMLSRVPGYIDRWRDKLAELDKKITAFEIQHKIGGQ